MCYVCEVCDTKVGHHIPQQKHIITREVTVPRKRTEIAQEILVCHQCKELLDAGVPLKYMLEQRGQIKVPPKQPAPIEPEPAPKYNPTALTPASVSPSKKRRDRKKISMEKKAGQEKQS